MTATRILVLCTGNSARSQIAEALLQARGAGRIESGSAGSHPAPRVNPWAERVLAEAGIPWGGRRPKGLDAVAGERWDIVLTVCDNARDACPVLPGVPILAHWGMPDPAEVTGSDEQILAAFRATLAVLEHRIGRLLDLDLAGASPRELATALRGIGAEAPGDGSREM